MRTVHSKQGYAIDIEDINSMLDMRLHDSIIFECMDGYLASCIRVHNGWIYRYRNGNAGVDMVFVKE